ncbi:MAG: TusE/DsrC/DsvC family sulfur relay protein [Gammaproteobacteria bacterium SHHR-1]|uniref:TusE/DsrC/DsvC family sulfur relay protein n=1 Tax=Magnetovirga frankeli TaxID=947516 RepID=UPI0012934E29|nr:TusE/DsrC/DsvC family sulfur relay protein [gamma proteobacterium SS-5]
MNLDLDGEGFLRNRDDWSEEVAAYLAQQDGYEFNDEMLELIKSARAMYEENGVVPPIRKFSKQVGVDSKHLYDIFKKGPMKLICKWGALPKPTGCV